MRKTNFIICSDIDNTLYKNKILTDSVDHTHKLIKGMDNKKLLFLTARPNILPLNFVTKFILKKDFVMTDIVLLSSPILSILGLLSLYLLIFITLGLIPFLSLIAKRYIGRQKMKLFKEYITNNHKEIFSHKDLNVIILLGDNGEGDEFFCFEALDSLNKNNVDIEDCSYDISIVSFIRDVQRIYDFTDDKKICDTYYRENYEIDNIYLTDLVCSHDEIMKKILDVISNDTE